MIVRMFRWWQDLMLGIRLAVSGGRAGWGRLALTAIGVGLGVTVLLAATSVGNMLQARDDRGYARSISNGDPNQARQTPVAGVDPVYAAQRTDQFAGRDITGYIVQKTGPNAPLAPGVDRLPDPGEMVLSPALAEMLNAPGGDLLRPRYTERAIGAVGPEGLTGPHELFFYVGVSDVADQHEAVRVYRFGVPSVPTKLTGLLWLLIVLGAAALLVPVVVFVASSARLAAAARDRRLAALRLVGADGDQVRRIAAGEAFVGALTGLLVGVVLFLIGRSLVPNLTVPALRGGIFSADISPNWILATLIVVAVPLLAVAVATFSLRRVIIEPLGVVRRAHNQRRRLWWRLVPPVLGIGLLATQGGRLRNELTAGSELPVAAGIVLLLAAVPLVLPWIVERVVARLAGGSPAWQLAIRRLQLDSGTPARVVGGVAVVLTGAIALQAMFIPATTEYAPAVGEPKMYVSMPSADLRTAFSLEDKLRKVPGAGQIDAGAFAEVRNGDGGLLGMYIANCDDLRRSAAITSCSDGDVFAVDPPPGANPVAPTAGQRVTLESYAGGSTTNVAQWTVPAITGKVRRQQHGQATEGSVLYATPAALAGVSLPIDVEATVQLSASDDVVVQHVRNALVPYGWRATAFAGTAIVSGTFWLIGEVLTIGSVITLLLAAASLLVVALEQIRERRRALAVLTANGVKRSVLARSLLWQSAVPIAVAVVVAMVIGLTLTGLLLYVSGQPLVLDWPAMALFVGTAVVAVLASTGCTLPSLWRAASVEGLRDE
ncbi:FtsX-like permease family protein [Kutzneria buriramensis]|uniref:FtsX-like permease family protein n=1 Tax=Kutzneria buriramensis TaxID=1045776 RepID=A0A3E0I9F2_9PSEU|nr:FtsX-like permease family protein [Kutzneria buriramensis]REH55290.1 FtsX-like permease family protein [Kutzneria buriramensis]